MSVLVRQRIFLVLLATVAIVLVTDLTLQEITRSAVPAVATAPIEQTEPIVAPPLFQYIEVMDSCGPYFEGTCVHVRSGPGEKYPVVTRLRTGVVLKVGETLERDGRTWYKIAFDEPVRYPERVSRNWYVAGEFVRPFSDEGIINLAGGTRASSTKRILVDRSAQMLYAYEGDTLFMQERISSGLAFTPTPRGTFTVYKKTPTRYMQGPLPGVSAQYYDLPGVPWNLYFTREGGVIHGAYWHDKFGKRWSHGCVNLPLEQAHTLYLWADVGTPVIVRD
ncbi:MAG: L,D-transpeptidase family protein [bacterium]|nr:L,D-transpeptidase family protein [bacterium]